MMEMNKYVPFIKRANYSSDDDKDEEVIEMERQKKLKKGHSSTEYLYNRFGKMK